MGQAMAEPTDLLRGQRIRLDALLEGDLPTLAAWYQDSVFLRLFDSRPAYPKAEAELAEWMAKVQKDKDTVCDPINSMFQQLWKHGVCLEAPADGGEPEGGIILPEAGSQDATVTAPDATSASDAAGD